MSEVQLPAYDWADEDGMALSAFSRQRPDQQQTLGNALLSVIGSDLSLLDSLIVARLPLALPPRAKDPACYSCGLLHIAAIYFAFEALWLKVLEAPSRSSSASAGAAVLLAGIHVPGLMRSAPLLADLRTLRGCRCDDEVRAQVYATAYAGPSALADFLAHIHGAVRDRPHVLLAYGYVFFFAIFTNIRVIRASLEAVGSAFWLQPLPSDVVSDESPANAELADADHEDWPEDSRNQPGRATDLPMSFLHFDAAQDGDDLLLEFEHRFTTSTAPDKLTSKQRRDILHEAAQILDHLLLVVPQIDTAATPLRPNPSPFLARLRDSIAVTYERGRVGRLSFASYAPVSASASASASASWPSTTTSSRSSRSSQSPRREGAASTSESDSSSADTVTPILNRQRRTSALLVNGGLGVVIVALVLTIIKLRLPGLS